MVLFFSSGFPSGLSWMSLIPLQNDPKSSHGCPFSSRAKFGSMAL